MDGTTRTKHFDTRFQQRGLNQTVVEALFCYGIGRKTRDGAESISFTKSVLREIRNGLGSDTFKMCEKLKNAYVVVSDDGALITVARSHRRTVH